MKKQKINYGFLSIRNRILMFSVLATLVPSLGMGWLLNSMMHATITEKIEQKLLDSTSIIDREISLWFKERSYDLRVFSNSFIIAENFSRYLDKTENTSTQTPAKQIYIKNIVTYLTSVQNQFAYYTRLFVLDNEGRIIAASDSADKSRTIQLPENTKNQIEDRGYFKGDVYFDEENNSPMMLIGTPLFSTRYKKNMGILATEVHLQELTPLLQASIFNTKTKIPIMGSLVRLSDGRHLLSLDNSASYIPPLVFPREIMQFFETSPKIQEFTTPQGIHMVGIVTPLEKLNWGLIIAENYDGVYAKLVHSRNRNFFIVLFFTLIISLAAYHFSTRILTPLTALTQGALKVAGGDLNVRLPVFRNDELGLTTQVFNEMVLELHQSHNKLKELATTDSLTSLANRKQIMETLHNHFEHYQRYASVFSLLMIDVDHFKKINDTYSHLAGDAVLRQLANILQKTLRNVDFPGRYGGEEFLIVLPKTNGKEAHMSAERIRQAVKNHIFLYEKQTLKLSISIGVASILEQDKDENSLLGRADDALYQAKAGGRDQVVYIKKHPSSEKITSISHSV